jgi:hypothetical protein
MAIDFDSLRKLKEESQRRFSSYKEQTTKSESFERKEDTRFWTPEVDKDGNGYAVIRFLDAPAGEDSPWVRVWSHGFKGPTGKWYIENSLTTLGQQDPVSEFNSKLWNTGTEANKEIVRRQKRKLAYISNILVVSDSKHPENNGKVFLFRYGKKIYDKIKDAMSPPEGFEDETPMNPFDFWSGANFKLKIRKVEGYRNYDKSEFETPSAIGDDDRIKEIWEQEHKLMEFLDPKNFKSYDELKKNLERVLAIDAAVTSATATTTTVDDDTIDYEAEAKKAVKPSTTKPAVLAKPVIAEDDSDLATFTKLANDDDDPF